MAEPALVATLRARLDKFEQDMDRADEFAEKSVKKIEDSFSSSNIDLGNAIKKAGDLAGAQAEDVGKIIGLAIGGGIAAALGAAIVLFKELNENMKEIEENARRAGTTITDFQRIAFAARSGGVSGAQIGKDLADLASKIEEMGREETRLSKLLDANGIKYKERGKIVLDTNAALAVAADLIARQNTEAGKIQMANLFGLTKEWVDVLRDGGSSFQNLQEEAQRTGSIINRETVERAAQFQREWNAAVQQWAIFFQAQLAGLIPAIDDVITKLIELGSAGLKGAREEPFKPLQDGVNNFLDLVTKAATEGLPRFFEVMKDTAIQVLNGQIVVTNQSLEEMAAKLSALAKDWQVFAENVNRTQSIFEGIVPSPRPRPLGIDRPSTIPSTAATGGGRDPFEVEQDRIRRSIALRNADTAAIGLETEARARARTVASLEEAAIRANTAAGEANTAVTNAQREAIEKLADQMLEVERRHRIASQIISEFRNFGNLLANAFEEAIFQGKKLDEVLKNLLRSLTSRALNQAMNALFNTLGSTLLGSFGTGTLGGGFNPVGGFGRQHGGSVYPGQMFRVGESGPEMFTPTTAGRVIPNSSMGEGTTVNIVQTYDARGADTAAIARLERIIDADRRAIGSRVITAMAEAKRRSALR